MEHGIVGGAWLIQSLWAYQLWKNYSTVVSLVVAVVAAAEQQQQ